jgi:hypothetical protein
MQQQPHTRPAEIVFKRFFIDVEASRNSAEARRQIDAIEVERALKLLLPNVSYRTGLTKLHDRDNEIIQEFFLAAFDIGLRDYNPAYSFTQYATYILFEACNPLQKVARARRVEGTDEPLVDVAGATVSAIEVGNQLQIYDQFLSQIAALQGCLAEPALHVFVDGLKVNDVAVLLSKTENAISLSLRRTRSFVARTRAVDPDCYRRRRGKRPHDR